jgi:toxin ParE1/3/4
MPRVIIRPGAWREIDRQVEYLQERAGASVAERFLNSLMECCGELAAMPRMGPLCGFKRDATRRLRRWPVKDFDNWLIFYQTVRGGVEIVHVIHGARDIESLLGS